MIRHAFQGILAVLATAVFCAAGDLTPSQFQELRQELAPDPDEPWRTIPWNISLLDAQKKAAQQRKPIFIWAMDGHPLGCT